MYFLFDVDGTLTPAREKITEKFKTFFLKFCKKYPVSLVSGSDYIKTQEQLGEEILSLVEYSFNCSGNAVYKKGELVHYSDWRLSEAPRKFLLDYLNKSEFPLRTGNHLEERIGAVNFSVPGRNATLEQRLEYYQWDEETEERAMLVEELNRQFTGIEAVIGGQIGVDIYQRGCDKGQVLKWYRDKTVIYFGDKCYPGGNDFPLVAKLSSPSKYYSVKKWQETHGILKKNYPI